MPTKIAKIAVSAATYWIDKPYDYLVPEELLKGALPGVRVLVPFSAGNRLCEGIILSLADSSGYEKLKAVQRLLDDEPILTEEQIRLALFMRDRFFCTVYDAVKAILPAGVWFNDRGERRVKDKKVTMLRLAVGTEEASEAAARRQRRSPRQAEILQLLCSFEALAQHDVLVHTGATAASVKALEKQELVERFEREVFRRPEISETERRPFPTLNEAQMRVFEGLDALSGQDGPAAALLFGVTGSGKTSVYVHLIRRRLEEGRSAILLVPEIALTPQMLQTFSSYFGDEVAVLHSSLSVGERYDEWKRIRSGKAHLVIGTRSAVFAPVRDLGLVIIDEEQEETYKSENTPRYHARDVAKYLCARAGCLLLMGSATPDVSSRYYAETGRYRFFTLPERYNRMALPEVKIVDMKRELRRGVTGDISSVLRSELEENLSRGEQSILFINRRGAHKLISCGSCGYTYRCPRCSVSLTYHSSNRRLICHYCGYSRRVDSVCPDCGGELRYLGSGTQFVVEQLQELFPGTEILRMDTDSVAPVGSHEPLFDRFREEKIPIMVGTQMVTKGLNFENVTLVGVLSADQSLYAGSYRAGERTFSLITQVVGRSGRGEKPGRAVIQTFTPENQTIRLAAEQDYEAFYQAEIQLRRLQKAPPVQDLLAVTASGENEEQVQRTVRYIADWLQNACAQKPETRVLGPVPLPVVRVNNRFRYRVYLSARVDGEARRTVAEIVMSCSRDKRFKGVSIFADNDPQD
ncbi:MAG: primosomal protein N' [Oscillospiraceae bacterium]|nr:primosomal protein N' [Oscillospiraceae bacterium]